MKYLLIFFCLLVTTNVPHSASGAGPDIFGNNQELKKLFSRELTTKPAPTHTITPDDGFFTLKARSTKKPELSFDAAQGLYSFKLQIGAQEPLNCLVFKERKELASLSRALIQGMMQQNSRIHEWVILKVATGLTSTQPYYYLQVIYKVNTDNGQMAGELELFVTGYLGGTVILVHDEPGYNQTFFELAKEVCGSASFNTAPRPQPSERRVYLGQVGGNDIGFLEQLDYRNQDGDASMVLSSTMLPSGNGKVTARDDLSVVRSGPDGFVVEQRHMGVADGNTIMNIVLRKEEGNSYQVKGALQGKSIQGSFQSDEPLPGGRLMEERIKEEVLGKGVKELTLPQYLPEINPLDMTTATLTNLAEKKVRMQIGPIAQAMTLDDNAVPQQISIAVGANNLVYTLVWSSSGAEKK